MIKTFQHRQIISEGYFWSPQTHRWDITRDVTKVQRGLWVLSEWGASAPYSSLSGPATCFQIEMQWHHCYVWWAMKHIRGCFHGLYLLSEGLLSPGSDLGAGICQPPPSPPPHTPLPCIGLELFLAGQRKSAFQHEWTVGLKIVLVITASPQVCSASQSSYL